MNFDHFYSDPHFGHAPIIIYCQRPFATVEEMTEVLIENYNKAVGANENVLWLGDCFFSHTDDQASNVLSRMNGNKFLVSGNHDRKHRRMVSVGFKFAVDQLVWEQDGILFRGSHFPWNSMMQDKGNLTRYADVRYPALHPKRNKKECLVHGHTHDPRQHDGGNAIHCGVDAWGYSPANKERVYSLLNRNGFPM